MLVDIRIKNACIRARALMNKGQLEQAQDTLNDAIRNNNAGLSPMSGELFSLYGDIYIAQSYLSGALGMYNLALLCYATEAADQINQLKMAQLQIAIAKVYKQNQNKADCATSCAKAIQHINRLAVDEISQAEIIYLLNDAGQLSEWADQTDQAISCYDRIISLNRYLTASDLIKYENIIGKLYINSEKYEDALRHFNVLLKYYTDNYPEATEQLSNIYDALVFCYIKDKDYKNALKYALKQKELLYSNLVKRGYTLHRLNHWIGILADKCDNFQLCIESLEAFIEVEKTAQESSIDDFANAYFLLGQSYIYNYLLAEQDNKWLNKSLECLYNALNLVIDSNHKQIIYDRLSLIYLLAIKSYLNMMRENRTKYISPACGKALLYMYKGLTLRCKGEDQFEPEFTILF